jgi:hypothetical protein
MWTFQLAPNLTYFVNLQVATSRNTFTIELAWSCDSEFPFGLGVQMDPTLPRGRVRLPRLWAETPKRVDEWSVVPARTPGERKAFRNELRRNDFTQVLRPVDLSAMSVHLGELVDDSVQRLVAHGIPFFQKVAVANGSAWTDT